MGEMKWIAPDDSENTAKILHLREKEGDRWQPYSAFPQHKRHDYHLPLVHGEASKGFATAQALLKQGWQYVKVD